MSDSYLKLLQDYGNQILAINDISQIPEPTFSVPADKVLSLFKSLKNDSNSPLDTGIYCSFPNIIQTTWESMKTDSKSSIRANLISASHNKINPKAMGRFADSIITVYQLSEYKWPELSDLIFKSTTKFEFLGFLFVRYCSTCNAAFFTQKVLDIMQLISDLIDSAQTSVQTGLIIVFSNLNIQKVLQQKPEFFENLWNAIYNVYSKDPERIKILSQALDTIYDKVPVLIEASPKVIKSAISSIKSDISLAKPLINLICYLSLPDVKELFAKLKKVTNPPIEIVSSIYEGPLTDIQQPIMDEILKILKSRTSDIDLALYAPFASIKKDQLILNEILDDKKVNRVLIGLKSLEFMARDNVDDEFIPEDKIIEKSVEYLTHSNQQIANGSYLAMKSLIENDVFTQIDDCINLLSVFEKVAEINRPNYFKLLTCMLKVDGVSDEIVDKVFDFAYILIRNNPQYSIECLHLFNVMFYTNEREELLTPVVEDLLPFSIKIIKEKNPNGLVQALRSLALFVSLDDNIDKKKITQLFPQIFDIADHGQTSKIKAEAAVSMITMAIKFDDEALYQRCFDFVSTFSKQPKEIPLIRACAKIAHSMIETKFAGPSLNLLCEDAMASTDPLALNPLLRAIKHLMEVAQSDKVVQLLDSFLDGSHPIFKRKNPAIFVDRDTQILSFMVKCSRIIPEMRSIIMEVLIRRIQDVPISMFVVYLKAIDKFESIPKPLSDNLAKLLARSMDGSTPTIDEIVLNSLMKLVRCDKTVYNIDILASQMIYYWDRMEDEGGWRAVVGTTILELAGYGAEVEDDVIVDVLADYPFSSQIGRPEMASKGIVLLMDNKNRNNKNIAPIIARCLADVLTLSIQKMRDLDLTETTRNEMKRVLKAIFDKNKAIKNEIAKAFETPERLKQRFQALL